MRVVIVGAIVAATCAAASTASAAGPTRAAAIAPGATCRAAGAARAAKAPRAKCTATTKGSRTAAPARTTTTTTPSDALNHKGTMIYGLSDGRLTRRADSGTYFETDSRAAGAFATIRQRAYAELNPANRPTTHPHVQFDYVVRPSFPPAIAAYIARELDAAAALWDPIFDSPITVRVHLVTEKDRDYVATNRWLQQNLPQILSRFDGRNERPFVSGGGGYWDPGGGSIGQIYLATASWVDLTYMNYEWPQVPRHEFFHVVQQYSTFKTGRARGSSTRAEYDLLSPQHWVEGGADTVSYLTAFRTLGWSSDALDWLVWRRSENQRAWMEIRTVDDAVRMMIATESGAIEPAFEMSYALGAVMYEWVIGTYGLDGFVRLLGQMSSAPSFDEALRRSIGISQRTFYDRAAPYVVAAWEAARG